VHREVAEKETKTNFIMKSEQIKTNFIKKPKQIKTKQIKINCFKKSEQNEE
jgi:hypothetical protein